MASLAFEPRRAGVVKANSLEPRQLSTPRKLKISRDFYQQVMLKHPTLSDFHSRAEHLYAGLLEGDPTVISYVPHPYLLRVGRDWYTPDFHILSDGQSRRVIELNAKGHMAEKLQVPVTHFLAQYRLRFEVVSNESVYAREIEAENWLEIVRILHVARDVDTTQAEQTVIEQFDRHGPSPLGELIDAGDRERSYLQEIALFRLLHQGHLRGELAERPLDYDTGFSLCM